MVVEKGVYIHQASKLFLVNLEVTCVFALNLLAPLIQQASPKGKAHQLPGQHSNLLSSSAKERASA